MNMNRFYVEPCDNCGTVEPKPPRDRTWLVMDRQTKQQVGEFPTRKLARREMRKLEADKRNAKLIAESES